MVKNHIKGRYGFTMIELIFAIVVISITVMSLPMITRTTSKAIDDNLVQEAIFASVIAINEAISYRWDEYSMHDSMQDPIYSRVVNTGDCNAATKKRLGHINRRCLEDTSVSPYVGVTYTDSIDAAAHTSESIYIVGGGTSSAGYKKNYNSTLVVKANASFGMTPNNANIKEVEVTILDADDNSIVTKLKAYSCNIGEVNYAHRNYP